MDRIIRGFREFRRTTLPGKRSLFKTLAAAQAPEALIITCADSRVIPELFTSSDPGQLFVCRNVGNIVPPYAQFTGGVSAAIEYAVSVLGVRDIIICGHSDCGAMKAVLRGGGEHLPAVSAWLRHAHIAQRVVQENYCCDQEHEVLCALTEENVVAQLDHLRTHPSVAAKLASGQLGLHGWVFDIEECTLEAYCAVRQRFIQLDDPLVDVETLPNATPRARLLVRSTAGAVR